MLLINMLPARQLGRMEYIFGLIKMLFVILMIVLNVALQIRRPSGKEALWTCNNPYGFESNNLTLPSGFVATGGPAGISTFTVGFNVLYMYPQIVDNKIISFGYGQNCVFVISPILFSATFGVLGFLAVNDNSWLILGRLVRLSVTLLTITYGLMAASFLSFFSSLKAAVEGLDENIDNRTTQGFVSCTIGRTHNTHTGLMVNDRERFMYYSGVVYSFSSTAGEYSHFRLAWETSWPTM
ncbi:hypothetical protein GQX73_g210 [Xylaria multiplex]|uniref:Amino acid permease/ SLC12A domain-containing protein n=1 Tax=Xylaria multiplex TaxID=323545 RepID=A0A7C8N4Y4_9PEZI|nr:hypothetical protein GQX73_g210 [Xylaria multiplex]